MTTQWATQWATAMDIPRWMILAMPDDVAQIVALVAIEYHTPAQQAAALRYYLRELRRTQWERLPRRRTARPCALKPSKRASGYRHNRKLHCDARAKVDRLRRAEIARKGAQARWAS